MIIPQLLELYRSCTLCPRACHVDRTKGELGYCRLPSDIVMDCALSHHGEEPPLSGTGGAGTIFLASCNLGCVYCQNYQISHSAKGRLLTVIELARIMIDLQKSGCHNVEPVTPTPQTPLIMEALCLARAQGLTVPLVYNCGGYENPDVIHLLDGMVDIYLPDFKYGLEEDARMFSDAPDYSKFAVASLQEMVRQVGMIWTWKTASLPERHYPPSGPAGAPGKFKGGAEAFARQVSARIPINLMSQYTPFQKCARIRFWAAGLRPRNIMKLWNLPLGSGLKIYSFRKSMTEP